MVFGEFIRQTKMLVPFAGHRHTMYRTDSMKFGKTKWMESIYYIIIIQQYWYIPQISFELDWYSISVQMKNLIFPIVWDNINPKRRNNLSIFTPNSIKWMWKWRIIIRFSADIIQPWISNRFISGIPFFPFFLFEINFSVSPTYTRPQMIQIMEN